MKRKILFLIALFFVPSILFFSPLGVSAGDNNKKIVGTEGDVQHEVVRVNGKFQVTITGTLNKDGAQALLDSNGINPFEVHYSKVTDLASADLGDSAFNSYDSENCPLNSGKSNPKYIVDSRGDKKAVGGDAFTCKITNSSFDFGYYQYQLVIMALVLRSNAVLITSNLSFPIGDPSKIAPDRASGDKGPNVDNLAVAVNPDGTSISITGSLDASAITAMRSAGYQLKAMGIRYGKVYYLDPGQKYFYVDSWQDVDHANEIFSPPGTGTFTASATGLERGYYVLSVKLATGSKTFFSSFVPFAVTGVSPITPQIVSKDITPADPTQQKPENTAVDIKIKVPGATTANKALIQIGTPVAPAGSNSASCEPNPTLLSPQLYVSSTTPPYINYSFSPQNTPPDVFNPGIYCIGVSMDGGKTYTYFPDHADLFSIGGVKIPDNLTVNPGANRNGCVVDEKNNGYCLLVPLPGVGSPPGSPHGEGYVDVSGPTGLGDYIKSIIRLVMGLIGVLSVVMIVVGGIEYMTTVNMGEKEGAKTRITNALFGLVLALGSYALLNTINPHLVDLNITIPSVEVTAYDENLNDSVESNGTPTPPADLKNIPDIYCPGKGGTPEILHILQSFEGKVTYHSSPDTGKPPCPDKAYCLDCSAFTNTVLKCAGLKPGPGGSMAMFSPAGNHITPPITHNDATNEIMVNGIPLKNGDVIGWKPGDRAGDEHGHAMMYANGNLYEVRAGTANRTNPTAWRSAPFTVYDKGGGLGSAFTGIYRAVAP